jgi:hypothetical protein
MSITKAANPTRPPIDAPTITPIFTLLFSNTESRPTVKSMTPNVSKSPDVAADMRRRTISFGLACAESKRRNPSSTITLPSVTEIMTICFSGILRILAKPETNAVRLSDPSPNKLIDPVSFRIIVSCSSA